jgi:hypothetical protein
MEYRRSLFGPLLLIAAGVMWLLVKSGNVPSSNLWALTHIWPFLLIAAGIGIILRPYWSYTSVALDVLIIGGAVLAILYAPRLGWDNPAIGYTFNDGEFTMGPTERGSGHVISETREVDGFTAVDISYPAQVFITQGPSESLKIEAEDNLLPGLQTRVRNNTLEIFYKSNEGKAVRSTKPVKITIMVKELNDVSFSSAGELNLSGIENDALNVSVSGAGDLKMIKMTLKDLAIDLSGAGSISASGTADNLSLDISGFGSFDGKEFHNHSVTIGLSGAGSATVWVDDHLDAEISGAGSVSYYGSPSVTKQVSGVGSVNQLKK